MHAGSGNVADAQVRQHIETLAAALRRKDIDAVMAHYSPDVVAYDLMPLQCRGADAYRKNFAAWFAALDGPIDYEMREMRVAAYGEVALCHHLARVRCTRKSGEKNDYSVRVSAALHKTDGAWSITHEHVSLPFKDAPAMQAALRSP